MSDDDLWPWLKAYLDAFAEHERKHPENRFRGFELAQEAEAEVERLRRVNAAQAGGWASTGRELVVARARIDAALAVLDALHDHGAHRAAAILRGETS
jgi:hypothetical protein